jgi:tRNA G37 N-methylase TrmD
MNETLYKHLVELKRTYDFEAMRSVDDKKQCYYRGMVSGIEVALAAFSAMEEVELEAERLYNRYAGPKMELQ